MRLAICDSRRFGLHDVSSWAAVNERLRIANCQPSGASGDAGRDGHRPLHSQKSRSMHERSRTSKADDVMRNRRKSNGRRGIRTCDFHRVRMVEKRRCQGNNDLRFSRIARITQISRLACSVACTVPRLFNYGDRSGRSLTTHVPMPGPPTARELALSQGSRAAVRPGCVCSGGPTRVGQPVSVDGLPERPLRAVLRNPRRPYRRTVSCQCARIRPTALIISGIGD
jgi:hypothetical protein